jgi:hypothetical protein
MPKMLSLYNGEGSGSSHMQRKYKDVQALSDARINVYPM